MNHQILERLGYSVATRTGSMEALDLFRSEPEAFDLAKTARKVLDEKKKISWP